MSETTGGAVVEIEYCVPCGYLDRALELQRAVLSTLGDRLDRAALVTGDRGVLQVRVDSAEPRSADSGSGRRPRAGGEVVWDLADDEYDVDEVVRRVRGAL